MSASGGGGDRRVDRWKRDTASVGKNSRRAKRAKLFELLALTS